MTAKGVWDKTLGRFIDPKVIGLNTACAKAAEGIALYLDGDGDPARAMAPDDLELAILDNRPIMMEAMGKAPQGLLAVARTMYGGLRDEFGRSQKSADGAALGHPYMWVLQKVSATHPQHAAVVMRHLPWWRAQCDQAKSIIFGDSPLPAASPPVPAPEPEPQPAAPEVARPTVSPPSM